MIVWGAVWRQRSPSAWGLRTSARRVAGELNYAFVDPYSLAHAAVGALLGLLGLRLGALLAIAIGWELAEHVLKNLVPAAFPHPTQDTLANSTGDVLSALVGWAIARGEPRATRAH